MADVIRECQHCAARQAAPRDAAYWHCSYCKSRNDEDPTNWQPLPAAPIEPGDA